MADGGEGTLDALAAASPRSERVPVRVAGPDGRPVDAVFLRLPDGTAVVELASTSGITLVDTLRPLQGHTRGFGAAIRAALDVRRDRAAAHHRRQRVDGRGSRRPARARCTPPRPRRAGGRGRRGRAPPARRTSTCRASGRCPRAACRCSRTSGTPCSARTAPRPSTGRRRAPLPRTCRCWSARCARLAALLPADPAAPGAGAAGGTGFGLLAWGASLVPGAVAVAEAAGLPGAIAAADLVITGEGRFDGQSAQRQGPRHGALARGRGRRADGARRGRDRGRARRLRRRSR